MNRKIADFGCEWRKNNYDESMKNQVDIEFERKIFPSLLAWAKTPDKETAILIEGARRVGKTTIVKKLAKEAYEDFVYIDFKIASEELKALFAPQRMRDLDDFFQEFFLLVGKTPKPGSLIIFDEVQYCLKAREDIKYLVADGRFDYIETGSLVSILSNEEGIQIPSEENILYMHPLDFEEFLWAVGEKDILRGVYELAEKKKTIPDSVHQKLMSLFRRYMVVGGMPKVLSVLLRTNSYLEAEKIKKSILALYQEDLRKYDHKYGTFCETIFLDIPAQLAAERESYRFIPGLKEANARSVKIIKSIRALQDFMLADVVYRSPNLSAFLETRKDESYYKLYYVDTGLLLSALLSLSEQEVALSYAKLLQNAPGINMGGIMESLVCQSLACRGIRKYYHVFSLSDEQTGKTKRYEIDFAFQYKLAKILIEVKASHSYKTESLDKFPRKYPNIKTHRYVVGVKNLKREEAKTTIPVYLLPLWEF